MYPQGYRSREDLRCCPRSPYAAAKAGGELMCPAYAISYGTEVVITRGWNTIGPRQFPEKLRRSSSPTPCRTCGSLLVYGDGRGPRLVARR